MKKVKRSAALLLIIVLMLTMCNFYVSATDNDSIYEETHEQINIKHIELNTNNEELSLQVKDDNVICKYLGGREQQKLSAILEKYPEVESVIFQTLQKGEEVCAIAYTEAPIRIYKDHSERVLKKSKPTILMRVLSAFFPIANAVQTEEGDIAYEAEQNFSFFTMISKQTDGTYIATSWATWEKGSWIGGSKYPASGYDYLLQSVPDSFSRLKHSFTSIYNTSNNPDLTSGVYTGVEGKEYTISDGGNTYLKVKMKDDPLGLSRLAMCLLSTTQSSSSGGLRTINSYYVHTWKDMDISVSVSLHSNKEALLEITPSISEKSWQLYSYVTFNF